MGGHYASMSSAKQHKRETMLQTRCKRPEALRSTCTRSTLKRSLPTDMEHIVTRDGRASRNKVLFGIENIRLYSFFMLKTNQTIDNVSDLIFSAIRLVQVKSKFIFTLYCLRFSKVFLRGKLYVENQTNHYWQCQWFDSLCNQTGPSLIKVPKSNQGQTIRHQTQWWNQGYWTRFWKIFNLIC